MLDYTGVAGTLVTAGRHVFFVPPTEREYFYLITLYTCFIREKQGGRVLIPVEVTSFALDPGQNTPLIILKEKNGERTLPVPIGPLEASAIAIESLEVTPEKPLTVDLVKLMMEQLGGSLRRVVIHAVVKQSLLARMNVTSVKGTVLIECRPSDAIALALRCDAPIFVEDTIFEFENDKRVMTSPSEQLRQRIRSLDTLEFGKYFLE